MARVVRLPIEQLQPYLWQPSTDTGRVPLREIFGNDNPVELEIGFGKGLFLLSASQAKPEVNFLGIEIDRKYYYYTANRIAKRHLSNVRLMCGDARDILPKHICDQAFHAMHIYFPDPWWKKRHHKRRLFTPQFIDECARVLQPAGELHIVTDVADYFDMISEAFSHRDEFEPRPPLEPHQPQHDLDYLTNFERKYRLEGRPIHRALFVRR